MNAAEARKWLRYDAGTGKLFWKKSPNRRKPVGTEAGSKTRLGYLSVCIGGKRYMAHRRAFLLSTGAWPDQEIDHVDGDGLNNRLENLRDVSRVINRENQRRAGKNNKSGILGVYVRPNSIKSPFFSTIVVRGRVLHLGGFTSAEAAHAAYIDAKRRYHEGNTL